MTDPRPTVGMVGGGQLARMCWQAAIGLDVGVRILAARSDDSAALVSPHTLVGDPDDPEVLVQLARTCDVVTFDHELVDPAALKALEATGSPVRPSVDALRYAQDKAYQRASFAAAGLPVPAHVVVTEVEAAGAFAREHGEPIVLKRPRGGYDGRGVWRADDATVLDTVWRDAAASGQVLVETAVPIQREVAALVARRPSGQWVSAPLIETVQRDGMLRELVVPARVPDRATRAAMDLASRVVDLVDVTGICAIEMFWTGTDLLINEIATRPHNCGHWTIDAATTSQFENHLRAVLDWPLDTMRATSPAVCTVNVLGTGNEDWPTTRLAQALEVDGTHVHLYGKRPRAGRKLGHVTATADDVHTARERAHNAANALMGTEEAM